MPNVQLFIRRIKTIKDMFGTELPAKCLNFPDRRFLELENIVGSDG